MLMTRPQIIVVTVIVAISLVAGVWVGGITFEDTLNAKLQHYHQLLAENPKLVAENEAIQEVLLACQNEHQMDQLALAGGQKDLLALEEQIAALNKQLGFYERLLSHNNSDAQLHIEDIQIITNEAPIFRLVLSQSIGSTKEISGRFMLDINGYRDKMSETLFFPDIDTQARSSVDFKFRYYQVITLELQLPSDFNPESLVLTLFLKGEKEPEVERSWLWSELAKTAK